MKKTLLFLSLSFSVLANCQYLVSITPLNTYSINSIQNTLNQSGWSISNATVNAVNSFKVTYNTVDGAGNSTIASGAVYIPQKANCEYAPITVYEHGTEFKKSNVPSTGSYYKQGLLFSTTGYISLLPDYIGLGVSTGTHLYHHSETEATATIDLIRAVREYLDTATATIKDNGELFITGYSHGGHAAMATNKYIQDHNLNAEFNIKACAPLSGAYALNGAQFDMIFDVDSAYYASAFLPYIMASYQEIYGNLYQNFNEVYDSPYDTQIENYLTAGTASGLAWQFMLGLDGKYYNFMQDSVLQNILADITRDTHPINVALKNNNLYDWIPNSPIRMIYCGQDSMVSPNNSIFTLDTMLTLGATNVDAINIDPNGDHNSCFEPATTYALTWFDSLATKCSYAGLLTENNTNDSEILVYPNPAINTIYLSHVNLSEVNLNIINTLGQTITNYTISNQTININELDKGIYYIIISDSKTNKHSKVRFVKL